MGKSLKICLNWLPGIIVWAEKVSHVVGLLKSNRQFHFSTLAPSKHLKIEYRDYNNMGDDIPLLTVAVPRCTVDISQCACVSVDTHIHTQTRFIAQNFIFLKIFYIFHTSKLYNAMKC